MQQEPDQELLQLEQQLSEAIAAENFFDTASGKLIIELINKRVNISLAKITSDKFDKDHMGFVNEKNWMNANKRLLRELQVAAHPARREKLKERLEKYGA